MKRKRDKTLVPEPMGIIMNRADGILAGPAYREPMVNERAIHEAARQWALWDNADPWAYGRMKMHLRRGYELPSDVLREANIKIAARYNAKQTEGRDNG